VLFRSNVRLGLAASLLVAAALALQNSDSKSLVFKNTADTAGLRFVLENNPTAQKFTIETMPGGIRAAGLGMTWSRVEEVLPFLVQTANSLGLPVLDWGGPTVYPAGRLSSSHESQTGSGRRHHRP